MFRPASPRADSKSARLRTERDFTHRFEADAPFVDPGKHKHHAGQPEPAWREYRIRQKLPVRNGKQHIIEVPCMRCDCGALAKGVHPELKRGNKLRRKQLRRDMLREARTLQRETRRRKAK